MLISQIITNFYLLDLFIFCISVLPARIYAYHRSVWCSWRSEDSVSVGNRTQVLCVSTKHSLSYLCSPVKPSYGIGALLAMLSRHLTNLFKNESFLQLRSSITKRGQSAVFLLGFWEGIYFLAFLNSWAPAWPGRWLLPLHIQSLQHVTLTLGPSSCLTTLKDISLLLRTCVIRWASE